MGHTLVVGGRWHTNSKEVSRALYYFLDLLIEEGISEYCVKKINYKKYGEIFSKYRVSKTGILLLQNKLSSITKPVTFSVTATYASNPIEKSIINLTISLRAINTVIQNMYFEHKFMLQHKIEYTSIYWE